MSPMLRGQRWQIGTLYCPNCKHPAELHHDLRWESIESNTIRGCQACDCPLSRHDLCQQPNGSVDARILDDGRLATFYETIFGTRILLGPADDMFGGDEEYMWDDKMEGRDAWDEWDGYGQPKNWKRHKRGSIEKYNPAKCSHTSTHSDGAGGWICSSCGADDPWKGDLL